MHYCGNDPCRVCHPGLYEKPLSNQELRNLLSESMALMVTHVSPNDERNVAVAYFINKMRQFGINPMRSHGND